MIEKQKTKRVGEFWHCIEEGRGSNDEGGLENVLHHRGRRVVVYRFVGSAVMLC